MYIPSSPLPLIALVIACVILPAPGADARQIEIHPRVGNELDQRERDYFNLFRQWPAGTVTAREASGNNVRFTHADSAGLSLDVHRQALASLGDYLDLFEDTEGIRQSVNFTNIRGFAGYRNRFRPNATPSFTALSGAMASNTLLHVGPDYMLVLTDGEQYNWQDANERVRILRPEALGQITQPRPVWQTAPRLLAGVAGTLLPFLAVNRDLGPDNGIGLLGMAGAVYLGYSWATSPQLIQTDGDPSAFAGASEKLVNRSAFADGMLAPEITIPFGGGSLFSAGASTRAPFQPATRVSVSSELLLSLSEREAFAATGFGLINLEPRNMPWLKIVVDRDRSRSISYGAEALIALNTGLEQPALGYSGQVLTGFVDWHVARPAVRRFTSRWSLAVGAGLTVGRMTSDTEVEWSPHITSLAPELSGTTTVGQDSWTGGLQLRASALYRLDDSKLARIQLSGWVPPLALSENDRNVGSNTIYGFDRVSLPVGFSLGVVHELGRK